MQVKQEMNGGTGEGVLQHSSVGRSLLWTLAIMIMFNAKVGTFPPSYAVIPSFISCFTTLHCIDPYFILKILVI